MVAPEVIIEDGIFILGYSFEEIRYSQRVKIIFLDFFEGQSGVEGMSRNCSISSKLLAPAGGLFWLSPLPPLHSPPSIHTYIHTHTLPKESRSHLACRLSGQLCLALGLCLGGGLLGIQAERASREVQGKGSGKTSARPFKSLIGRGAPLFCIKCFAVNF